MRDVSAALSPARLTAVIGPNAAGKSTLLRLMLGQLRPWAGRVLLHDRDAADTPPAVRARLLSYVPQRTTASFAFTVEQVVQMGRHALPPDPAAVQRALEVCDLVDARASIFAELSVGQQQRVLLARALAQSAGAGGGALPGAGAMLLDEPSSAMDPWHVHQTMRLLRQQAEAGLAVLVVLHDLNLAARYADDVWLLDRGTVAAQGPWQQVMQPCVLEPIYRVRCQPLSVANRPRPVFLVEPAEL